ncbi:MAG TPA: thermonuclease family protein [Myxococcota bacterium]|nr:thermonuclease family protein [Myxococcota bacterium]
MRHSFALLLVTACGVESPCGPADGRVAAVRDGDTIVLESGEVVRYLGVDTPERDACYGDAARSANMRLVNGATVELTDDIRCRDVYDRRLAYVSAAGEDVGASLLARGFARVDIIPPNDARADAYRELADAARAGGRGLWGACR